MIMPGQLHGFWMVKSLVFHDVLDVKVPGHKEPLSHPDLHGFRSQNQVLRPIVWLGVFMRGGPEALHAAGMFGDWLENTFMLSLY